MPYAADVYTVPPGTPATTLTPIDSSDYNAFVSDIEAAQNAARPVVAGGTGAQTVIGAWDALAKKGTDIATAASINLTTATGPSLSLTGTTTVTGVTLAEGSFRVVRAAGAFQITASANLLCNGSNSVNMSVSAEDTLIFRGGAGGVVSVSSFGGISAGSVAANYLAKAGGTMTGSIVHAAGTTSLAPANFQSGPVKTTAAAGDIEFDGKAFYLNAVASSRQVVAAMQTAVVVSAVALSNSSTAAQNILPSANDVLTVQASTTYRLRGLLLLTTGATSATKTFSLGGTATFTSIAIFCNAGGGSTTTNLSNGKRFFTATAAGATFAAVPTDTVYAAEIEAVIRVNAGGTIIPQVTFGAGPTGTCQVEPNTFFELWPIGSDTVAAVGNWA